FEGTETDLIEHLQAAGGSGGARPKLNATLLNDGQYSTDPYAKGQKLIVKLTSERFLLKHEESLVEYLYLTMAKKLGIEVPEFELIDAGNGQFWLQQTRFDCSESGRYHMLSAAGLLDASFREPSLDYVDLIKATRIMCGVDEAKKLVKRALFNYVSVNQDDHSKNFSFLANDQDEWRLSPCYDIVYSPSSYGEHMTAFNGNGAYPDKVALEQMAGQAGFGNSKPLYHMLEEIYEQTQSFKTDAKALGVSAGLIETIDNDIGSRTRRLT
ncbi:MAG: HipA domain-containing protein, partial [Idiomarina sp.]|nr:HipA domain-containing protein [Idiomarina sp.]